MFAKLKIQHYLCISSKKQKNFKFRQGRLRLYYHKEKSTIEYGR